MLTQIGPAGGAFKEDPGYVDIDDMVFESRDRLMAIIDAQARVAEGLMALDEVLDLVARKARELTESAGGLVEKIDRGHSVIVSADGSAKRHLGTRGAARDSLAAHAVDKNKISRCGDSAREEEPAADAARLGARSWVSVPILEADVAVATLTVLSPMPHHFEDEDIETIRLLGRLLEAAFSQAANRKAASDRVDPLTGLGNKTAFKEELAVEVSRAIRYGTPLSLVLLQLDGSGATSSSDVTFESLLCDIAGLLQRTRLPDRFFSFDGGFAVIMPNTPR
ncbi:MAG: sensor domain-containing diguanylate cyclase, partial [Actinomycetota bacterium]